MELCRTKPWWFLLDLCERKLWRFLSGKSSDLGLESEVSGGNYCPGIGLTCFALGCVEALTDFELLSLNSILTLNLVCKGISLQHVF